MSTNPTDPQAERQTQTASADDDLTTARARIEALEKELAEARERADRFHSNWQRSAADFQNWKRRTDQEKTELSRVAESSVTVELLRVLDDFDRAFQALPNELRTFTWVEGVFMIGQKLHAVLQARGLSPIEALGQEFDPFQHEAVLREEGAEGSINLVVVQELQRGYRFHEKVIRPTMVKVGLPPSQTTTQTTAPADTATVIDAEASDAPGPDASPDSSSASSGESEQPVAS